MLTFQIYTKRQPTLGGDTTALEVQIEIILEGSERFTSAPMILKEEVDAHVEELIQNLKRVREEAKSKLEENCF